MKKRQSKKLQKQELEKQLREQQKRVEELAKRQPRSDRLPKPKKGRTMQELESSIAEYTALEKRYQQNEKRRVQYAENRDNIKKYGLQGVKPSDSPSKIAAAIKAQQDAQRKKAQRERRKDVKFRNRGILEGAGVPRDKYPPRWYEMGEDRLNEWIKNEAKEKQSGIIEGGHTLLYIGWGSKGESDINPSYIGNDPFNKLRTTDQLRSDIETVAVRGSAFGSGGHAGHTEIIYRDADGSREACEELTAEMEAKGYHTIFCGYELSEHAFMRYTTGVLTFSPEDNRKDIMQELDGYLTKVGREDIKFNIDFSKYE